MSFLTITIITYPRVVAVVLALAWLGVACTHWRWPMAFDAALIALYATRPSVPLLVFGLVVVVVRWFAPFAAIVAELLHVNEWGGLSFPAALFLLPGLQVYVRGTERHDRATLPPVQVATGATTRLEAPARTHARPLESAEWFAACNDDPTAPHLGVIGPTQLGKTTFALALAGRRAGAFVVTTTKDDAWASADVTRPAIRLDQGLVDWAPVTEAIGAVHFEMLRRYGERDTQAPTLTLIIDEFTTTLANIPPKAKQQITEIWSMGAAASIRTIVIAQEVNARAWGLEGRRDILGNLLFARVSTGRLWALGRLDPNGGLFDPRPLDTARLVALATEARLAGRGWRVPGGTPPSQGTGNVPGTGNGTPIEKLVPLVRAGITRDQARQIGYVFRDETWTKAREQAGNASS
jgi:hypothetical protein